MTIAEINMLAKLENMTYGAYVLKMGQKLNRASDEYILQPGEIRCKSCNRAFTPKTRNAKYCKPQCRSSKRRLDSITKRKENSILPPFRPKPNSQLPLQSHATL